MIFAKHCHAGFPFPIDLLGLLYPLGIKHGVMGNTLFIGDFRIKTPISSGFPIATFDYLRVDLLVTYRSYDGDGHFLLTASPARSACTCGGLGCKRSATPGQNKSLQYPTSPYKSQVYCCNLIFLS